MRSKALATIAAAGIGTLGALPASAYTLNSYCGPNLCFVWDIDQTAATPGLYGQPFFDGDNAFFLPTTFEARSTDGVGFHAPFTNTDTVDSTFVFKSIYTLDPNNEISNILAFEQGDYEINSAEGAVTGNLYLTAIGLNDLSELSILATDSEAHAGSSGGVQNWDMFTNISPVDFVQVANNISLSIQNTLTAFTSEPGSLAWIEKKLVLEINTVIPVDEQIPVPAAAWLFGSAFGVLALVRRRRAA